ncbi:MAG: cell division protein ZapA [Rhizobacter sp.]|nr:cell division protein ZapA [Chlorobiales bacterium]
MESVKVKVFGDDYPLRAMNKALTEAAAREVDTLMRDFKRKATDLTALKLAVLAAIQLAERNLELEQRLAATSASLSQLNEAVETVLSEE